MKTILYATSEVNRLPPLTEEVPAPLLPVLDRPVMSYAIEMLKRQGIREIEVCLYHGPGEIEAYFGDGRRWGVRLNYHLLREPLGDGGTVRRIVPQLDETLLLLPADILIDLDIQAVSRFHQTQGSALTVVAVDPVPHAEPEQLLTLPADQHQLRKDASSAPGWLMPTGVYLLEPPAFGHIPTNEHWTIFPDLWQMLSALDFPLFTCPHEGYWNGLYSFESYFQAQIELLRSSGRMHAEDDDVPKLNFISCHGHEISQGVWCGQKTLIHNSVQVAAPLFVCENSRISKDVRIGPEVVIGRNVVVDEAATLSKALVLDHTYIGRLVDIDQKIVSKNLVIDIHSGEHIRITDRFLLDKNRPEQVDSSIRRIFDGILAAVLLLIFSPLLLVLSILIILNRMPLFAPVFRLHVRQADGASRNPQYSQLELFRFATRRPDGAQSGFGGWLEKKELHRLVELLSVVKGDLSLVGVKPLDEDEVQYLNEEWQLTRFAAPAGFTGLWYINQNETLEETLVSDVYYAALRDWRTDARILLQTPGAWWRKSRVKLQLSADSGGVN